MPDNRIDKVTVDRANLLHPLIKPTVFELLSVLADKNIHIRIVQGLRTFAEQDALYAQGRTTQGQIVTKAKGGQSFHNYGLAFDFCILKDDKTISWNRDEDLNGDHMSDWMQVVNLFIAKGYEWGGNWTSFPDYPHIQKIFGLTIQKALDLYNQKKVDSNGYIII